MGTAKHIIFDKDIAIFTDSLSVIKSLTDVFTKSDLVQECQTSFNKMPICSNIAVYRVQGYGTYDGNKIFNELTWDSADCTKQFPKFAQQKWDNEHM